MTDSMTQIILHMSATFALGLALGWALWGFVLRAKVSQMSSEVEFWRKNHEDARLKHQVEIESLTTQKSAADVRQKPRVVQAS